MHVVLQCRAAAVVAQFLYLTQQHHAVLKSFRQPNVYVAGVRINLQRALGFGAPSQRTYLRTVFLDMPRSSAIPFIDLPLPFNS